jgi:hypothetical protein
VPSRPAAGIAADKKAFLFRTSRGHGGTELAHQPMTQVDAWRMVRKRALAAGIKTKVGNYSFRATEIMAYLANGGALEHAQSMAAHEKSAHDQALCDASLDGQYRREPFVSAHTSSGEPDLVDGL